ncbi:hypothetical protein [Muricoccus radiodurans]|uniref:hypothetical protein n=1 Tax=Muricoccus radiodurans TaxID=2231721 RepID=UPI003CF89412
MAVLVTPLAEAWLLAFLLLAGLVAGAMAVLAAGLLLGEAWLGPLRPALAAVARVAWLPIPLAVPLPLLAGRLYPWAGPEAVTEAWNTPLILAIRGGAVLILWAVLGRVLARPGAAARGAGLSLLMLVPTAAFAFEDWGLSRHPGWSASLQGLAMVVGSAGAALALVTLPALGAGRLKEPEARTGLERALLTLAVAALWLAFVQFLTVWAADLPNEVPWFLRRAEGIWRWVKLGVAVPTLLGAIALAAVPQWRPWRMTAVCGFLLLHHVAELAWTVRPDAASTPGAAFGAPNATVDAVVLAAFVLLTAVALRAAHRGRAGRAALAERGGAHG